LYYDKQPVVGTGHWRVFRTRACRLSTTRSQILQSAPRPRHWNSTHYSE